MTLIRCVITDDEPFARKGMQKYVEQTGFLELKAVCENALQLAEVLNTETIDLLLLDIEMPYLNGVDFLRNRENAPKVIFTTAFENYALQGYELDVLDYLLKPVSFERFTKAVNKAYDYFKTRWENPPQSYFFIKSGNKLEKLFFSDILFAEAMENYVAIYTPDKKLITHSTLKSFQQQLPVNQFVQTHKSYIVNMQQINSIEGNLLHIGKYRVAVSKYLKDQVFEKILHNKLLKK